MLFTWYNENPAVCNQRDLDLNFDLITYYILWTFDSQFLTVQLEHKSFSLWKMINMVPAMQFFPVFNKVIRSICGTL